MDKTSTGNFGHKLDKMRLESELEKDKQDTKSRSRIACGFTVAFIALLSVIIVGVPLYNCSIGKENPLDVSDLVTTFVAQFGTPLGFVLGYYFKDKNS